MGGGGGGVFLLCMGKEGMSWKKGTERYIQRHMGGGGCTVHEDVILVHQ
jgi:hypothetical protein